MTDSIQTTGLRLVWDQDAEVDRILAMSDAEVEAEALAEGRDIHAEAEEIRSMIQQALEKHRG